ALRRVLGRARARVPPAQACAGPRRPRRPARARAARDGRGALAPRPGRRLLSPLPGDRAARVRTRHRCTSAPPARGGAGRLSTAMSVPVTERSALSLARSIRAGEIGSREVVDAHLALLEQVNPRINAVVVPRFEAAREEASAADARIARAAPDEELPPLLGVPCTIKESIAVAGMPN